jgi:hypothetical protein
LAVPGFAFGLEADHFEQVAQRVETAPRAMVARSADKVAT